MNDEPMEYDERQAELDVAGAELGWDGATTQAERDLESRVIHICKATCYHGGPIYVRWPWKTVGAILEEWPENPETHMPPGFAVSMGAEVKLLREL